MDYNINLNGINMYTLLEGRNIIDRGDTVRMIREGIRADGKYQLKVKIVDAVNYVERVTLLLSENKEELLAADCTCGNCRGKALCAHIAAVLMTLNKTDPAELSAFADLPITEDDQADPSELLPVFEVLKESVFSQAPVIPEKPTLPKKPVATPKAKAPEKPKTPEKPKAEKEPKAPTKPAGYEWDGQYRQLKVLLGHETESGEPVYWYPSDTEKVFHTNTGVIGTMGTGKTQFTKSLVAQIYHQQANHKNFDGTPLNFLIFDYKGDYNESKQDFTDAVKAKVYKPYRLGYNPLALIRGTVFRPLLPVHTANTFKDTLSKAFGLGAKQQHLLLDCILAAYEKQGISPQDPTTWDRPAPTFAQVYEIFLKQVEGKAQDSLFAAMYKLHTFCIFEPDPRKAVSLSDMIKGVTVLDISGHDPDIQKFVIAITLDQFYAQMLPGGSSKTNGKLRQLRTLILVDEADKFMREDFAALRKILKEGREFGVGVILSTQSLKHFAGGDDDYSRYVLTWIVHNVSDLSKREIEYIFKLQEKSRDITNIYGQIKDLVKHESIVKISGSEIIKIHDKPFYQLLSEGFDPSETIPDTAPPSEPASPEEPSEAPTDPTPPEELTETQ